MAKFRLRAADHNDRAEVAELICASMNTWDILHGMAPGRFSGGPAQTDVFWELYEQLDPGHCIVVENAESGRLAGSCFYRERETHVSLGIMNVHPNYFGHGIAKDLLRFITEFTDERSKPLRLVSSVMNLESFSLYTKAGFVPTLTYQDLVLEVPAGGLKADVALGPDVRDATAEDLEAIARIELEVSGISRAKDYRHFVENPDGHWSISVIEDGNAGVAGFLASFGHPELTVVGPGVSRTEDQAAALLIDALNRYEGLAVLFLVPVGCGALVQLFYGLGARNCELHAAQVRGDARPFAGVSMPTFVPETG